MQTIMMPVLPRDTIEDLYPRYAEAWEVLQLEASARHLLASEEFAEEMLDPRLEKHVVLDEDDRVVAMTTLTTDLHAIPWINPTFYHHRFPQEQADGRLYYLGYTFVDVDHRRTDALALMAEAVNTRLTRARGVIGFDICGYGVERGIGRRLDRMFSGSTIIRGDTQTYYIADYRHPHTRSATGVTVTSLGHRPDLVGDVQALLAEQWPSYTLIGNAGHGVDLEELLLRVQANQLLMLDDEGRLGGVGLSLPVAWDGAVDTLPTGWDDAIRSGEKLLGEGGVPDALCVLSITVSPTQTRRGLAERMINALKRQAAELGAHAMIAPVRPSDKSQYPLISMEEYLTWTLEDGRSFDPWLRLHTKLGGRVLAIAPESMVITGSVTEWETWLGQQLPGTGDYVIEGGLAPLQIDRAADQGRYVEPNVWVGYPITG